MRIEPAIQHLIDGDPSRFRVPASWTQDNITSFVEFGVDHFTIKDSLTTEQIHSRFDEIRKWMQHVSEGNQLNAVYLDTTTLHMAKSLILTEEGGMQVTPGTLFRL